LGSLPMMPTASLIHSPSTSQGSSPWPGQERGANGEKRIHGEAQKRSYRRRRTGRWSPIIGCVQLAIRLDQLLLVVSPDRLAQIADELDDGECLVRRPVVGEAEGEAGFAGG
jgi:hypothetical protein